MARILPFLSLLFLVTAAYGQNPSSNCPTVSLSGPGVVHIGAPMSFTANLTGKGIPRDVVYEWTISAGTITSGQDTASITVDTTGLPTDTTVTASVLIKGLAVGCGDRASENGLAMAIKCILPVDQYGEVTWNEERARMDNMWIQLKQNWPDDHLYIFMQRTAEETLEAGRKHAKKMMAHFISRDKQLDTSRIVFVIYVGDNHMTIAFFKPKDAEIPQVCESGCIEISGAELVRK